jgi:hypothetical protein
MPVADMAIAPLTGMFEQANFIVQLVFVGNWAIIEKLANIQ